MVQTKSDTKGPRYFILFLAKITGDKWTNLSDELVSISTLNFSMDATSFANLCFSAETGKNGRSGKPLAKIIVHCKCLHGGHIINDSSIYQLFWLHWQALHPNQKQLPFPRLVVHINFVQPPYSLDNVSALIFPPFGLVLIKLLGP